MGSDSNPNEHVVLQYFYSVKGTRGLTKEDAFISGGKSPSLTFLAVPFLRRRLLEGPVRQQEEEKHQANPSGVHYTQKNSSNLL